MYSFSKAHRFVVALSIMGSIFLNAPTVHADALSITSGNNVTTTPNVATAVTGFQIVGPADTVTPVKLFSTSGTLSMTTTAGLTFDGASTGTVIYFSGTVANINAALSTLKYSRATTGTDTLEVSLVPRGEAFFTGNNHLYKFISGSISWTAARAAALAQTAYGATGYLATITSSQENTFVSGRLTGDGWIGGSDSGVEGDWRWMDGPEANTLFWRGTGGGSTQGGNYASWSNNEPNQSGEEDCAETYVASGTWNDLPCGTTVSGYVVEFGAPGSLPAVVAKNISVTTADVPAVTSLSPTGGAVNATVGQNLVIGFSKTVTKGTGNILIKKVSDNTTVESIDVTSGLVTGQGTNSITINPDGLLAEGVAYYVIIPNTAFKDASDNFFGGIADATTWTFTVADITAPIITDIATSAITDTGATVTWTTNEVASSKVTYSTGSEYDIATSEVDISPRVTSHSQNLTGLTACTTYNFKVVSRDAATNSRTSSSAVFTTTGCPGGSAPISTTTTTTDVTVPSTTILTSNNNTMKVDTPANITTQDDSVVIQVKSLDADATIGEISRPANLLKGASVVFEVTALINSTTVLHSFDAPVTLTYTYSDEEVAGLDKNTLWMYHYHNNAWARLNDCVVDTNARTVTCTSDGFSIFGIFGSAPVVAGGQSYISGGSLYGCRDPKALNYASNSTSKPSMCVYASIAPVPQPDTAVVRDLQLGMVGQDVLELQKFLNAYGFIVATKGPGSKGNETIKFGTLTRTALIKFQKKYKIKPAVGYYGPVTRKAIIDNNLN